MDFSNHSKQHCPQHNSSTVEAAWKFTIEGRTTYRITIKKYVRAKDNF